MASLPLYGWGMLQSGVGSWQSSHSQFAICQHAVLRSAGLLLHCGDYMYKSGGTSKMQNYYIMVWMQQLICARAGRLYWLSARSAVQQNCRCRQTVVHAFD